VEFITATASVVGVFPPEKANFDQFLKAAHTVNLAQDEAFRAAASSKATVGSAYGMAFLSKEPTTKPIARQRRAITP